MSEAKFDASDISWDPATATMQYLVIYGPQPRWWWCRYLPTSWRWAWPSRPICYSDMREKP